MKLFHKKKFLGQHFLHDQKIIEKIINFIAPEISDHMIEIGSGTGALTTKLLLHVNCLDVIELDREVIPELKKNCKFSEKLHVHIADVLKFDFTKFQAPIRIVGNLPYNISTPLLFKTIENIELIKDLHFMLQKEVAERIVATPGSKTYGRLSVMIQYYFDVELLLQVGSGAFSPPPKVESAFIKLVPRKNHRVIAHDKKLLSEIVRTAFCARRKTIANGLKKYITTEQLKKLEISPTLRPEQLSVDEFVVISNFVNK